MRERFKKTGTGAIAGILVPLALICFFAFCALALALLGGNAYKNIQTGIDDSFDSTVAVNYLRTKLAQNNGTGQISMKQEGAFDVLVIAENLGEQTYETRIYVIDGELRETFIDATAPFEAATGTTIAYVHECRMELTDSGLFKAEIMSPEGTHTRLSMALVTGGQTGGGAP